MLAVRLSIVDASERVSIAGVVEVGCDPRLLRGFRTHTVSLRRLVELVDLHAGHRVGGLCLGGGPAVRTPGGVVLVQAFIVSVLPEVEVLLDADLASDGCSGRAAVANSGCSAGYLREIGDDLSQAAAD